MYSKNESKLTIEKYLESQKGKKLLRFITCGSVDDGKSTLIGRLLFDSKMILEDQMLSIINDSKRFNSTSNSFDLSLLVDGLQAEREQGITIDIAYRFFSTDKKKYIIADTPGHIQYTRNMVTGASNSDLAIVMIDARYGIQEQTKRHTYICSLLGIKHLVIAVNKMDLINYDEVIFNNIKAEYQNLVESLNFTSVMVLPISALDGDNVVHPSNNMGWNSGPTLLEYLDNICIDSDSKLLPFRFSVQLVSRSKNDFRGYAGTISSGSISVGDEVKVLPLGKSSKVERIYTYDGDLLSASSGMAVTLLLSDELDISRGDMVVKVDDHQASINTAFSAHIVWMSDVKSNSDRRYKFKFLSKTATGKIHSIDDIIDINNLKYTNSTIDNLDLNDIATCRIELSTSVVCEKFNLNKQLGSFIIIDPKNNLTVACGMINSIEPVISYEKSYTSQEIELNKYIRKNYPEWNCIDIE